MNRRTFLASCLGAAAEFGALAGCRGSAGETLYNGIVLPQPWPPRQPFSFEPRTPPYLLDRPSVIPIDVGRQLFVDDFLIDGTNLTRRFHRPTYAESNPVLSPDRPWEQPDPSAERRGLPRSPSAAVFSDGVFWDPDLNLFRMWYMSGYQSTTSCATSTDGIHWNKPSYDVVPGTNIVLAENRDSATVWRDALEPNPSSRFKMTHFLGNRGEPLRLFDSPDGIHWTLRGLSGPTGDRSTMFYNPFRRRWIYSLRDNVRPQSGRLRLYWEATRFVEDANWKAGEPVPWVGADRLDVQRSDWPEPELYALDCVAYESVLLGLFSIWRLDPADRPKLNDVCVGFSRDGFHWSRLDRTPFLPRSEREGDWNWGNVQSAGGGCVIANDRLHFYVSGRAGAPGTMASGRTSTGLATLRRDGFCSMDAGGEAGYLTTRPLTFSGRSLFVNADTAGGALRVEVVDLRGNTIDAYARDAAVPIAADGTKLPVRWRATSDLAPLRDVPVRLRFHLSGGSLYSFWVSPSPDGRSRGYVAGGGPGFDGAMDD